MSGYWLTGVRGEGRAPADGRHRAGQASRQDRDRARPRSRYSILPALVGNSDISLRRVRVRRRGERLVRRSTARTSRIDVTLDSVDLGSSTRWSQLLGVPLKGKLGGTHASSTMPEGKAVQGERRGLPRGDRTSPWATARPRSRARSRCRSSRSGTLTLAAEAKEGSLKITKLAAGGKDVELQGDGRITLRDTTRRVALRRAGALQDQRRLPQQERHHQEPLRRRRARTLPPLFELADPKVKQAKRADGFYAWTLRGPLGHIEFIPPAGAAAGAPRRSQPAPAAAPASPSGQSPVMRAPSPRRRHPPAPLARRAPRQRRRAPRSPRAAARDARALQAAGFDLVMIENFGDAPFFAGRVPAVTVSAMTACALAVREACPATCRSGINVLRNDAEAALSVAAVVGAQCIRVNVHTGARVTDQGVVEGRAAETLRLRRALGAEQVAIWARRRRQALGAPRRRAIPRARRRISSSGAWPTPCWSPARGRAAGVDDAKLRRSARRSPASRCSWPAARPRRRSPRSRPCATASSSAARSAQAASPAARSIPRAARAFAEAFRAAGQGRPGAGRSIHRKPRRVPLDGCTRPGVRGWRRGRRVASGVQVSVRGGVRELLRVEPEFRFTLAAAVDLEE